VSRLGYYKRDNGEEITPRQGAVRQEGSSRLSKDPQHALLTRHRRSLPHLGDGRRFDVILRRVAHVWAFRFRPIPGARRQRLERFLPQLSVSLLWVGRCGCVYVCVLCRCR
jgi:hypothetical protein